MPKLPPQVSSTLFKPFNFQLGGLDIGTNVFQAVAVVVLLFLLVITLAQMRRRFVDWHLSGAMMGVAFGFFLALIIEGLLIVGGRTILTETLGWKSAPKPISNALDAGRGKLVDVLGTTDDPIPASNAAQKPTIGGIMEQYETLSSSEKESLQSIMCTQ